ncbi:MAG: hypothetical protein M3O62_12045 [Pseudomonadota bacterium]|nr:hypothetical protein [Pseudomonadota bacterium]
MLALAAATSLTFGTSADAQVQRTMVNTGFELPLMDSTADAAGCVRIVTNSVVPGWITTDPNRGGLNTTTCQNAAIPGATATGRPVEFWSNGSAGFRSRAGNQFVELNAYNPARLRQDVCMVNGETVGWRLSHQGRGSATVSDVMEFRIGSTPIARMSTSNDGNPTAVTAFLGAASGALGGTGAAGNGWVDYSGQFTYSAASGVVDVGFEAISAAGGNPAIGNFLDSIQLTLRPFVEFASPSYQQIEGSPALNIPSLRVVGTVPAGGMNVPVTITGGTATLGVDYTTPGNSTSFTVSIPEGVYDDAQFPLPIIVIDDGSTGESGETIELSTPVTTPADPYNLASLRNCGGAPQQTTLSTIAEAIDPLPSIQLNKALASVRLSLNDQFALAIQGTNGVSGTTTGSGASLGNSSILVTSAAVGSTYILQEVMAAGSTSALSAYSPSITCTNTSPTSTTVLPSGPGSLFSVVPAATDVISCTFTNRAGAGAPSLSLVKAVTAGALYDSVGDVASYSYQVTNVGSTALSSLTVNDNKIGAVSCPVTTLAVGASTTCTANYTIVPADIDARLVTNIAQATALTPGPASATVVATDDAVISLGEPRLTLQKTAAPTTYSAAGQVINYQYLLSNIGNVAINALAVSDDKTAVSCPVTTLAPGASTTCTASYSILQTDVDAGSLTNVATATGTSTSGALDPVSDNATVTATATPALTLDKTETSSGPYDSVGDVITYQYRVTNTGAVTISALSVTDDRIASISCPSTTLTPAATVICTGSYTLNQADINAGSVANNASAQGTPAIGTLTPATDSVTVTITQIPAINLDKSGSGPDPLAIGDTVNYSFLITNTGNVSLSTVTLSDPLPGLSAITCPVSALAPAASTTCTADYVVTAADAGAGVIVNTASVDALATTGGTVSDTDTASVPPAPTPPPVSPGSGGPQGPLRAPVFPPFAALLLTLLFSATGWWALRRSAA